MTPFQARATAAVEQLARRHRVLIHWKHDSDGEAHIKTRQVWTKPPSTILKYLSALHELGHIVDRWSVAAHNRGDTLTCEAAAWEYALAAADPVLVPELTRKVRQKITSFWGSYIPSDIE